jgi:hypothetical protein
VSKIPKFMRLAIFVVVLWVETAYSLVWVSTDQTAWCHNPEYHNRNIKSLDVIFNKFNISDIYKSLYKTEKFKFHPKKSCICWLFTYCVIFYIRNGPEWWRLRSEFQQGLSRPQSVKLYLPQIDQVIQDFIDHIITWTQSAGKYQDFLEELSRLYLECKYNSCKVCTWYST